MDISEKANGFSPGRLTVRRTVRTPVRSTLAVSSRLPSLPVVGVQEAEVELGAGRQLVGVGLELAAADQGEVEVEVVRLGDGRAGAHEPQQQRGDRDRREPEPTHLPSFHWVRCQLPPNRWSTTSSTSR
jgi:hypothetical protein